MNGMGPGMAPGMGMGSGSQVGAQSFISKVGSKAVTEHDDSSSQVGSQCCCSAAPGITQSETYMCFREPFDNMRYLCLT